MAGKESKDQQDPRIRSVRKKLAQILAIEEKSSVEGLALSEEQLEKLRRKAGLEAELQRLLEPPPEPSTAAPSDECAVVELADTSSDAPAPDAAPSAAPAPDELPFDPAVLSAEPPSAPAADDLPTDSHETACLTEEITPDESDAHKAAADPRVRAVKKKLAQITELEKKCEEGCTLGEEQLEKLDRKAELEAELASLLLPKALASSKAPLSLPVGRHVPPAPLEASGTVTPARMSPSLSSMGYPCRSPSSGVMRSPSGHTCQSPSVRWVEDPVAVEDIAPALTPKVSIKDARFVVTGDKIIVFKSCEDSVQMRTLRKGDFVEAADDVQMVDGYEMLPIKPQGAVEFSLVELEEPLFEIIENVQPFSLAIQSSDRLKAIMKEVSELSCDAFEEDALSMVTRKGGWKMTLMACPAGSADCHKFPLDGFSLDAAPRPSLIGFLIYRLRPDLDSLSIAKLAIVPEHRQQGHGRRFIEWCIKTAKKSSSIIFISLSSLPEAVKFYQRLGFRPVDVNLEKSTKAQCGPDEDLVEGQVYMEYRVKGRRRKK